MVPSAAAQTQRITFDDAVALALERNVDLKKAENDVLLQDQLVAREKADFLPNLNLSLRPSRSWGLTFDQTSFRQVTQTSDFFSVSASSSVTLFDGFGNFATLREAQHTLESSSLTLERRRQTVFFNVIQAYLQIILDKEQVRIRAEDVESQQQQLRRIEEFTRVGSRPISDLYQQQATLAASELQLLEAERSVQLSEVRLIQVLELDPLRAYEFDAPSRDDIDLTASTYELDAMLQNSFDRRLDLQALDASISSAEQGIRAAKSGRYPSLTLFSSGGSSYSSLREEPIIDVNDQVTGFEPVPFADQLDDNRSGSLGLTLSIPIFNRLFTKTGIQQARIRYNNLGLDRQNLRQNIALEVRQTYLDYLTAVKRLDVTEKQVRSARQAEQVESERYDIGASTLVELTQARASLVDAESQRAQAVYQFLFQGKVIEYYLGTLNPSQTLFR